MTPSSGSAGSSSCVRSPRGSGPSASRPAAGTSQARSPPMTLGQRTGGRGRRQWRLTVARVSAASPSFSRGAVIAPATGHGEGRGSPAGSTGDGERRGGARRARADPGHRQRPGLRHRLGALAGRRRALQDPLHGRTGREGRRPPVRRIDPRPFEAALQQAQAQLAQHQAQIAQAQANLARDTGAVGEREASRRLATRSSPRAASSRASSTIRSSRTSRASPRPSTPTRPP